MEEILVKEDGVLGVGDEILTERIEEFEINPDILVSYFCILCGKYEAYVSEEGEEPAASAASAPVTEESDKEKIFNCLCDLLNVKPKLRSSWDLTTEALPLCKTCVEVAKELLEIKEEIASFELKLREKVDAVRKLVADSEEVLSSTLTGTSDGDTKVTGVNLVQDDAIGGIDNDIQGAGTLPVVEATDADAAAAATEQATEIITPVEPSPAVCRDDRFFHFRKHILDVKKKKGRKPNQRAQPKVKEEGNETATAKSEIEVKPAKEEPVKRTSRGRVIKRPEMFKSYAQNLDDAILEDDEELEQGSETGILVPKVEMQSSENEEEEEEEYEQDPEWSPGHGLDQDEYYIAESDYSSSGSDDDMDFEIDGEAEEEDLTKELAGEGDDEGPPSSKKAKQNRGSRTQKRTKKKNSKRARDDDSLERPEEGKLRKNFTKIPIKIMADGESYDGFFMKEETADKDKSILGIEALDIGENIEVVMEEAEIDQEQVQDQIQDPAVAESVEIVAIPHAGEVIFIEESLPGIRIRCTEKGCRRTFSTLTKVKVHIKRKHLGITKPYSCSMCEKCFQLPGLLRKHMADHGVEYLDGKSTRRKTHTCGYEDCGQTFRNPATLVTHIRSIHTGERPFRCTYCPDTAALESSFVTKVKLEFHTEQAHPDVPPLKCEYCPRGFYRPHRLREHTKAHTGEKSYLCDICSKSFGQLSQFKIHQSIHEGNPINRYRCEQCEGIFTSAQNLKLHQQTQHGNEYRFHCEICGQGVTHLSILKIHMRSHTGEKPYSCDLCSRTFRLTSQLRVHMRTHTGERPYQCQICEKTFAISGKLRRHELIHAQEREFKCQFCEKSFIKPCNLMQHTKRAHGTVVIMEIN